MSFCLISSSSTYLLILSLTSAAIPPDAFFFKYSVFSAVKLGFGHHNNIKVLYENMKLFEFKHCL